MTVTIWQLPCMSQEFNEGPVIRQTSGQLILAYDFETESGEYAWDEMTFTGVAAFKFTAARFCIEDQVSAYDKLQVVETSSWVQDLADPPADARHYRAYFDDIGCYEVLASGFVPPRAM